MISPTQRRSTVHSRRLFRLGFARWPALFLLALALATSACSQDVVIVGILEQEQNEVTAEARTGFLEALRDAGYKGGENARFVRRNAEVREQPLDELAQELVRDEGAQLVLAIGTPALLAAAGIEDVPVLFAMIGDTFAAGYAGGAAATNPAVHNPRITGAAAMPPIAEAVAYVMRALPQAALIGVLAVDSDPDSKLTGNLAQGQWQSIGGTRLVVERAATSAGATQAAERLLAQGVQAILLTTAPLTEVQLAAVISRAEAAGVPVFGTTEAQARAGAVASIGTDPRANGRIAGGMAARVLGGTAVASIAIATDSPVRVWTNAGVAKRFGITLPLD